MSVSINIFEPIFFVGKLIVGVVAQSRQDELEKAQKEQRERVEREERERV